MRILLAHNSPYYPAHGGGDRSNRLLLEALAQRGHVCRVVARTGGFGPAAHADLLHALEARAVRPSLPEPCVVAFVLNGVEAHTITGHANPRAYFAGQMAAFVPDVILASTDDPAHLLLDAALRTQTARVVYLARATMALPFGPDCAFPSAAKTAALSKVNAAVGVSRYVAEYIRRWSGIDAVHVPISLLEPGPYPCLGRFDNEFVTLVNPCAVKGISIFLALAGRMPSVRFAAVPTWGTNKQDRAALAEHPNIRVLDPVDRIDDLLARTRVLLVPSLWAEARSRIVVDAMLRGVPVLAANVGGIPEAKLGVDYLLPVRPIGKYRPQLDEQMVPAAEVPEQDIGPWEEALRRVLTDREHYERLSRFSREAALGYAESLSIAPFENLLETCVSAGNRRPTPGETEPRTPGSGLPSSPLERLSPEKRKLLALRLRKANAARWFPSAETGTEAKLRLFCFPHAGGGASAFARWAERVSPDVAICAARLPGRENRAGEPPLDSMAALVDALGEAIQPYTARPFVFFGHSMGAVVSFELARLLRRRGRPLPLGLIVSGARAPQFRLGHIPPAEPSEAEFLGEVQRLEGMPAEVLSNRELLDRVLPALRADAALYRSYVYAEEPPLACPIQAYGGLDDPNVRPEHVDAWRRQTSSSFTLRTFPGGHFFLQTAAEALFEALGKDLTRLIQSGQA